MHLRNNLIAFFELLLVPDCEARLLSVSYFGILNVKVASSKTLQEDSGSFPDFCEGAFAPE